MTDLRNASRAEIEALYAAAGEGSGLPGQTDSIAMAERALSLGEPLLAYDICRIALGATPCARLRQLQALALARSGAREQAQAALQLLYEEGQRDEETLGILARLQKDRWLEDPASPQGRVALAESLRLYREAYRSAGGYWSGINAATLALVCGDAAYAAETARAVRAQCAKEAKPGMWVDATLGEAALVLGEPSEAAACYARASAAGAAFGDRASMRRNAGLILMAQRLDPQWLQSVLPQPVIGVFSGHMPDAQAREAARFPEERAAAVREALGRRLREAAVDIGYASAASGGDILFHEAMLGLGRETHVVLPEPPERFVLNSVADGDGAWRRRFDEVLRRASSVVVHSQSTAGTIAYTYNNWMILGLARARARQIEGVVTAYAVWDGEEGLEGGTASAVHDWRGFGQDVEWFAPLSDAALGWRRAAASARASVSRKMGSQRVVSLLFADAVGFSKLPDERIPAFVEHFLGAVARTVRAQHEPPLTRNTWGDGLYFSFASPHAAGLFALELCDVVRRTDWTACGLPAGMSLRIALHCGPAYEMLDPVTGLTSYTGAHVSRAARIEPVTPPGSVYASQSFASLCECERVREFACDYVGRMPLAKKYGEYPMYVVRSRDHR